MALVTAASIALHPSMGVANGLNKEPGISSNIKNITNPRRFCLSILLKNWFF
ncbi:hypothetical protein FHK98_07700 [Cylindrospermopsis raciborskii CS-506_A]|uniref:Uncharacterized protein n=1 Tax=Cylindrospermopsis raciborskii CS-506_A TaxID=2585140 RepID=A0A838WIW0_9CYAN|nr:hypothetical protein [Cylindrospermopsis raciborskii]MBA4456209.1 hypothetical protein [Cylindrospermopsis raciborskii CS-506_B]MBA4465556.1 hypothetical protein [Cylindrospermopsis raciborskii CS-506_A]